MIGHLINLFIICGLFLDMLERRFPTEFKNFMISASYNSIYYFSKLQILVGQTTRKLDAFIENNPSLLEIKQKINFDNL